MPVFNSLSSYLYFKSIENAGQRFNFVLTDFTTDLAVQKNVLTIIIAL